MSYSLVASRGGTQQVVARGRPVSCTICNCVVSSRVRPPEPPAKAHYLILKLPHLDGWSDLRAVDALVKSAGCEGAPLDVVRRTLLVKLPHGGRRFLFTVRDADDYESSPYDLPLSAHVDVHLTFGGVWPESKGYTWNVTSLRLRDTSQKTKT